MSIRIDGLTKEQCRMLDEMWSCNTLEEIHDYRDSLDTQKRMMFEVLMELVILETYEQEIEEMKTYPDAEKIMKKIKKTG